MIFEFDKRVFDTDKDIYVLGFTIRSWFPLQKSEKTRWSAFLEKISIKKCRIQSLKFKETKNDETGKRQNIVSCVEVDSFHADPFIPTIKLNEDYIFGKSTKECKQILESICIKNGVLR